MAGTLFKTQGVTKHFNSLVKVVSDFIPNAHFCTIHCQSKTLAFTSVLGSQGIPQSWCKVALKSSNALYPRHIASCVKCCSATLVVNSCVTNDVFWRKPISVNSGGLQRSPLSYNQMRYKSKSRQQDTDDESDDSDEDVALEDNDFEAPPNFKVMKISVVSTRADAIVSHVLDVSRNKLEEIVLGSGLYLNGGKLLKKSVKMDEGDYVDLVMEKTDEQLKVKRVKILKIYPEKTSKDKIIVKVRAWKAPFFVANPGSGPR